MCEGGEVRGGGEGWKGGLRDEGLYIFLLRMGVRLKRGPK